MDTGVKNAAEGKKALIVTMTCGEGHNSVARSIKEDLVNKGYQVREIELFGYSPKRVKFENWQYLIAAKYFPRMYHLVWSRMNKLNPNRREKMFVHGVLRKCVAYIKKEYELFKPDALIATHPYSAISLSTLKKNKIIPGDVKVYLMLTDYCVHPLWEGAINADYVFTPAENTTEELIRRGFKPEQIVPIGYPVASKFKNHTDKNEARARLGFGDKFTVMVMSGGFGMKNNVKLVKQLLPLKDEIDLICICGKNKINKKRLERFVGRKNLTKVKVLGFVNNIDEYMSASDCLVTIGGAVSLTEALYKNIPLIIREKMRINCKLNAEFFKEKGCALALGKLKDLSQSILYLKNNPRAAEKMKRAQNSIVNRNAAEDIANFITNTLSSG
jgi:processive 1,2-diacylglycerol beta-glucosyltransferase